MLKNPSERTDLYGDRPDCLILSMLFLLYRLLGGDDGQTLSTVRAEAEGGLNR